MSVRILHCSTNVKNYNTCVEKRICGFKNRGPSKGDTVYLAVRIDKDTLCGARCKLTSVTDENPWDDEVNYVNILRTSEFEYCKPFPLSILSKVGGKHWGMKYTQAAKPISDENAISLLEKTFNKNKTNSFKKFSIEQLSSTPEDENESEACDIEETISDPEEAELLKKESPDLKMKIMGTFQAIPFVNEADKINGLETMVTENFYSLFPAFDENNTILIPENRKFITEGVQKNDGTAAKGIKTIPDGLLLKFDIENKKNPIQINLIEYECYGQRKTSPQEKSKYLNATIIPQLMRFASGFSITTDRETRGKTISSWIKKLSDYLQKDENISLDEKMTLWVKKLYPKTKEKAIYSKVEELLKKAFETNIRVLLIIDELTKEQKSTIKNIINAFKLENGCVEFEGYVVSLVQRINIKDMSAQYALTVQN